MALVRIRRFGAVLMTATLASACAGTPADQPPSLLTDPTLSASASDSAYVLSPQELGYSCKKLTGTMQVRLLQVRRYDASKNPSLVARSLQSVTTPIFGGTTVGIDPAGQHQRDLAMLEAYNRQLAAKKCKTFDLAAELQKTDPAETPEPAGSKKNP
jgi:hypothetical protein